MDLFTHSMHERMKTEAPLAARMRPRTLDEFIGQEHIVGQGKLLRREIEAALERRKLYQKKTVFFVTVVRETLNWPPYTTHGSIV